jgi:Reverse transcriptase (RNA-dependent DNA polymerase)
MAYDNRPTRWNELFISKLFDQGFEPLQEDPCILIKKDKDQIIIIYVDDMIIAASTEQDVDTVISQIAQHFGIKTLGEPSRLLGCKLTRDESTMTISQDACAQYIDGSRHGTQWQGEDPDENYV